MTPEELNTLNKKLNLILDNQVIIGEKLNTLQSDLRVAINNQLIYGRDQDQLIADVKKIKNMIMQ